MTKQEEIKNLPLDVQRGILESNVEGSSQGFPSGKQARQEREARSALNAFDVEHPEILANEKAKRDAIKNEKRKEIRTKMHKI